MGGGAQANAPCACRRRQTRSPGGSHPPPAIPPPAPSPGRHKQGEGLRFCGGLRPGMGWEVIIGVVVLSFSALHIRYNMVLSLQWIESELPVENHEETVNSGRETPRRDRIYYMTLSYRNLRQKGESKMRISISAKNLEISDYLRELVEKKVSKLERYFPQDTVVQVTLSVERNRHIVEVTIPYDGGLIRAEEVTGDMYASIDNVLDKLEKQILRHRTRLEKSLRSGAFKYEQPLYSSSYDEFDEEDGPRIVRVKRFNIKPMDEQEAMLQAELLSHSFYVFLNAETNAINVLYKRKDGNYGLIEPEN